MNLNRVFPIAMLAMAVPLVGGILAAETLLPHAPDEQGTGVARFDGPFTLVDDTDTVVTQASLAGKPTVMYFGYTYSQDAGATTSADLSGWIQKLGAAADKLNFVFVTLDPERDNPKVLHKYLASFDHHIRGYTGTSAQIAEFIKAYGGYLQRITTREGGDRSAVIYLTGSDGRFVDTIDHQEDDASAIAKLKSLTSFVTTGSRS